MNNRRRVIDIVIAIIAGIAIWAYVVSVTDPVTDGTIKSVPVQLTNTEAMYSSGLAIAGTGEYTVDVVVTGNRSSVNALSSDDFIATADVSGLTVGQNYITVNVIAPSTVTIKEIRTQNIQVYADNAVTVEKDIKIVTANLDSSLELGAVSKSVETVSISGAKSLVDTVTEVQANIDVAGVEADGAVNGDYSLIPINSEGNRVYGVNLSQNTVNISAKLYGLKEVALNVPIEGEFDEHVSVRSEIIPASVSVKGPSNILSEIWQIDAEAIDVSTINESCSIPLNLILPNGVERANASWNLSVDYELKGRIEKSLSLSTENIVFSNSNEEYEYSLAEPVEFVFSVYEDEVDLLSLETSVLSVDVENLAEGEYSLVYIITLDEGIEDPMTVSAPETINIVITKPEADVNI